MLELEGYEFFAAILNYEYKEYGTIIML